MRLSRVTCPQCQQPAAVQQTCLACGYAYPPISPLKMLLRLAIVLPVGIVLMLTILLMVTVLSKYVVLPAMAFIWKI